MIGPALFGVLALTSFNIIIASGTIFSPMKVDEQSSLNVYKPNVRNNEFEYSIGKRSSQDVEESPDSKERRSQMGSSFIRFGRNRLESNIENVDYTSGNELDTSSGTGSSSSISASRIARGRPDIIIRFGRSDSKNLRGSQLPRSETKYLRMGNKLIEINDIDQLASACSNILANSDINGNNQLYLSKFLRLCSSFGFHFEDNDENRRKSKIIEFIEDPSQGESIKH